MKKAISLVLLIVLTASGLLAQPSLKSRMEELEKHFGIHFVYESGLELDAPYNGRTDILPGLEENLDELVRETALTYSVRRNYVSLKRAAIARYTLKGHVCDALTSETLISAGVIVKKSTGGIPAGTVCNEFGFYSITLPEGEYDVEYSYIGYEKQTVHLKLDRNIVMSVALGPEPELQAALITARPESGIHATRAGSMQIPDNIIRNTPVLLGEADVLKTLQLLPGVQGGLDGFSGIFVRGGSDDENLLLLDGVPVYNAEHMLGIFSVFTPESVKKVTLYKSDFPARYGGRVSSVVDVRTNDGDMHNAHGTFSAGLLSDKLHLEGPIREGRDSYSLSARVVHTFLFTPVLKAFKVPANYYFYDFNGKINHRFSDRDRVYAALYHGRDYFQNDDCDEWSERPGAEYDDKWESYMRAYWGNTLGTRRWNHVYDSRLFSNATLFVNSYRATLDEWDKSSLRYKSDGHISSDTDEFVFRSGVMDYGAKMDYDWNPSPEHAVRFGAAATLHTYSPSSGGTVIRVKDEAYPQRDTVLRTDDASHMSGWEFSLYGEDDFVLGPRLRVNAGMHLALFSAQGRVYFSPQPRLSARFDLGGSWALKAGYSRMAQYIHKLASGSMGMPTDHWVPITRNIRPVTSDQFNVGCVYSGQAGWEFSADAYLKEMDAVLEYKDAAMASAGGADWDRSVAMGHGRAYGIELLARKTEGNTTGWIAYTLGKSDRIFRDGSVNNGKWFPYRYDRRHVLTLCANHKFSGRVDLSAVWNFASGAAMTMPTRTTAVVGYDGRVDYTSYVPARGNFRLPPSHRLDLSVNLRKHKLHGERIWNFGIYNVYARRNPNMVNYDVYGNNYHDNESFFAKVRVKKYSFLIFVPSFNYTYRF